MKIKNLLLVHKLGYTAKEKKTIDKVRCLLRKNNILFRVISPLEVHPEIVKDRDLIIIVGGDGTFLKVAQHINDETPFLCVNANIKKTEGFFSNTSITSIENKLNDILIGKFKKKRLMRLSAKIDGKTIEPCVNEYYVGQKKPYDVSNYVLIIKNKKEPQKSSGVLVSTPAGSTAWTRGAGGKIIPINNKLFQFVVREPYVGKLTKTKMRNSLLKKTDKVIIIPKSEGMVVVSDAIGHEHNVKKNTKVEISMSKKPICLLY